MDYGEFLDRAASDLGKELHARGRDDEMLQALQDKDKLALLLEEFSIA